VATPLTATWQPGFLSLLPHVNVACCSIGDVAHWSSCDGCGPPMWWVVGIMGGGVEEAKVGVHGHCGQWWWLRNKRRMDE